VLAVADIICILAHLGKYSGCRLKTLNGVFTAKTANFAHMSRHHQAIEKYKENNAHRYRCSNEHILSQSLKMKNVVGAAVQKKKVKFPTPL